MTTTVVTFRRCVRCGIDVEPTTTWGHMCRDCHTTEHHPITDDQVRAAEERRYQTVRAERWNLPAITNGDHPW